jgi:hypothetical protein
MTDLTARARAFARTMFAATLIAAVLGACGSATTTPPATTPGPTAFASPSETSQSASPPTSPTPSASPSVTQEPDVPGGNTGGDIPDNAVFLTYHSAAGGFSIQYVEGWQVSTQPDGVVIKDKDSSETVVLVAASSDVAGYVSATDLPTLEAQAGFKLIKQDSVKVGSKTYVHLAYHLPAPPDPVTGKRVPATVDRYYVPGPGGLAIISLSTPDGIDNVDAFRQMIQSFAWT